MPLDYTLPPLPCWTCGVDCGDFTALSNHHLEHHERPLERYPVPALVARTARDVTPPSLPGGEGTPQQAVIQEGQTYALSMTSAQGIVALTVEPWAPAAALACRECGTPVPDSPDHRRLQLCGLCRCCGLLAYCHACGENWPEHGPGGKGCATWLPAPDAPLPGVEEPCA